ncbi:putative F-box/LRR-repeat protein 23 [Lotus japonicus]|uniref:putative F-box/LRR-repeat protein 23 n=1 Tax=Lotus japonicus TaxID=34305 RepID=UPI00258345B5|nr:putative F-box/LRR-repeat protein 23 [Lotus japonicus]
MTTLGATAYKCIGTSTSVTQLPTYGSVCMMAVTEGETTNSPNWLELPNDVTITILQKLDAIEIVTGASGVCSLWWNICKDPSIWRTIVMINLRSSPYDLKKICCFAVSRSCGLVEDLNIEYFATDDLLFHIADRTSNLRRLCLAHCKEVPKKGLLKVVKQCPLLEEIDISFSCLRYDSLEDVRRCCPLSKTLKFNWACNKLKMISVSPDDVQGFAIANTMPQLCVIPKFTDNFELCCIIRFDDKVESEETQENLPSVE